MTSTMYRLVKNTYLKMNHLLVACYFPSQLKILRPTSGSRLQVYCYHNTIMLLEDHWDYKYVQITYVESIWRENKVLSVTQIIGARRGSKNSHGHHHTVVSVYGHRKRAAKERGEKEVDKGGLKTFVM